MSHTQTLTFLAMHPLSRPEEAGYELEPLFENVVTQHSGHAVAGGQEGGPRIAAFPCAGEAVRAALAFRGTCQVGPAPGMTLHTGDACPEEDGRCCCPPQRLRFAAAPGRILLSGATALLVRQALPEGYLLRDLGPLPPSGGEQPDVLFELVPAGARGTALGGPHHPLVQLTGFIGRERELAEVNQLLCTTRLLTLTGPSGCGKTRLCYKAAGEAADLHADGICVVELGSLADPVLVPRALARALELQEADHRRPLIETLTVYLQTRRMLIVLDNCEHLLEPCAALAELLLRSCPGLQIMATSLEPLRIPGETVWRVPPLAQGDAVRLFAARARAALPQFEVTEANSPAVAQICHQLDRIPLALELAAAWVGVLSVEQIAARLGDRFRLLTGGSRTATARQRTLRAAMDWSHDLLSEPEQRLFRRLSVFVGGFTLGACEAVCADDGIEPAQILPVLSRLVDKSLVVAEGRYRLLETVRHYSNERLQAAGEANRRSSLHMAYHLKLAEQGERELAGPRQAQWLERLEREHDNLRAALRRALEAGEADLLLRLANQLSRFWKKRGHIDEGRAWLQAALARTDGRTEQRAAALAQAGVLASLQADYAAAQALGEESLAIYRELGRPCGVAALLNNLGLLAYYQGDLRRALQLYEEGLSIRRAEGDLPGISSVLNNMAMVVTAQGEGERARRYLLESLSIKQQIGDKSGIANALNNLGNLARCQGDLSEATALSRQALALWQELKNGWGTGISLMTLGLALLEQGDLTEAERLFRESLVLRREMGDRLGIAECIEALAAAAARRGAPARGLRLFGAAEALREVLQAPLPPEDQAAYDRSVAAARKRPDEGANRSDWAMGRAMPLDEAIDFALREAEPEPEPAGAGSEAGAPGDLTTREVEIVQQVARGLSDREIAGELAISPRTVDNHLRNIFGKLELSSRTALVAWAFRKGVAGIL